MSAGQESANASWISPIVMYPGMAIRVRGEGNKAAVEIAGERLEFPILRQVEEALVEVRFAPDDTPIYDVKINGSLVVSRPGQRWGLLNLPKQVRVR